MHINRNVHGANAYALKGSLHAYMAARYVCKYCICIYTYRCVCVCVCVCTDTEKYIL